MVADGRASFGERLRGYRERTGLTQEGLAERAGLTAQAIASLERGRRKRPHLHTVTALAEALELTDEERKVLVEAASGQAASNATPAQTVASNMPLPPTPLIGRERDIEALVAMIGRSDARLVTLTGPGGVGKTRLAVQLASDLSAAYSDGIAFVALAPLGDAGLVVPAIARSLGLKEAVGQSTRDVLDTYLRTRNLLLVLDNFEQLLDAAPQVSQLLASCPGLTVLATSRAPLRVRGEREYPVQPLELPELGRVPYLEEVLGNPAVGLFAERARDVTPDFELGRANVTAVAAICRRLDGLPLAIELAAARLRTLSPTELLARLDQSLPLLTGGARDLPERQRTMRRAIEWSYDLLGETEQRLFRRLSVFRGGWTVEAAEVVGAVEGAPEEDVLYLMSELVEQALVVAEKREDAPVRYRMLVPVREYATERLDRAGEAADATRCHARYFLWLAERAEPELSGPGQVEWLEKLEVERDNVRVALDWLLSSGDQETAICMAWNLYVLWWIHGYHTEGRRWMQQALESGQELSPHARARALTICGAMALGQGDLASSEEYSVDSYTLFKAEGDELGAVRAGLALGLLASARADLQRAELYLSESAVVAKRFGAEFWAALLTSALGMLPFRRGDYEQAEALLDEGLTLARRAGDRLSRYIALYNHSQLAQARGDYDRAAELFAEGLVFSLEVVDRANVAHCLEGLAAVAVARDLPARAARLLGAADSVFEVVGARVYTYRPNRSLREQTLAAARARLDEQAWTAAWEQGRVMTMEQAVEYALQVAA